MGKCKLKFFSNEDIEKMRVEAIKILADVGLMVSHNEAKKMLKKAGARVDDEVDLVHIPSKLTEECLKMLPQKIILGGRDPENDITLERNNDKVYFRPLSGAEAYIDLSDRKYRTVVKSDVRDWGILVDALEYVDISSFPYDSDLNASARDVRDFEIMLENNRKHIAVQIYGPKNLQYMIQLGIAERGSEKEARMRPRFLAIVSPVPPLHYHANTVSMILEAGKYGIPIALVTMPLCGASGPVTLAGSVLLALGEHLAAVVISQVANPGAPVIFTPRPLAMDLKRGVSLVGAIETSMMWAALGQAAKEGFGWFVDLMGPNTDSFIPDGQALLERSFGIILSALAGADLMCGAGLFEAGEAVDPVLLVIDNEFYGMMARTVRGIEVNDDTLGLEAIRRVGAGTGKNYLTDEHTLKYLRTEFFKPSICTRSSREVWESEGGKDLYKKAKERAIGILEEHKPIPLKEAVVKELRSIVENAERDIKEMTTA